MSLWIDHKYVGLISNRLQLFKQKGKEVYNFRCPICTDSEQKRSKCRGYIFNKSGKLRFYCHNCGASHTLGALIKIIDRALFDEYNKEKFIENNFNEPIPVQKVSKTNTSIPEFLNRESPLSKLKKISSLPVDHPFKKYVMGRRIPVEEHFRLFYCENFKAWVNSVIPGKFEIDGKDEPRLIIPFIDRDNNVFGCQGRSLGSKGIRYITIMFDETKQKIFGLNRCDFKHNVFVLEGPIDSLFFKNAIAMCGSDLTLSHTLKKDGCTIVFDNEPRSKEIVKKLTKYISSGFKVCIWPDNIEGKDINEMILKGYCSEELKIIIDKNTFAGIEANLRLQMWRKC